MLSYFNRWASVVLSVRSLTATSSMSAPLASAARKKFRPIRPKPLIPTRTVMCDLSSSRRKMKTASSPNVQTLSPARPGGLSGSDHFLDEHLRCDHRLGVRDAQIAGALVGQGEQPPDAAGDRVLGQRRVGQRAQLLKRRLPVLQPQL